jgi:hypothetical protein
MLWDTWRRYRSDAGWVAALLVVLGAYVLALTVAGSGAIAEIVRSCAAAGGRYGCFLPQSWYDSALPSEWGYVVEVVVVVPAIVGVFVGAPLVPRELEHGTHLIAWTQSIPRGRWFLARVGLLALGAAAAAAALAGIAQGWFATERDLAATGGLPIWSGFDIAPPVVIAYALFALALGVAAGAAIRRTVPAIVVALIGFVAVRVTVADALRWRYLPPVTARQLVEGQPSIGPPLPGPTDWQLPSSGATFFNAAGHPLNSSISMLISQCTGPSASGALTCPRALNGVYVLQEYQPGSRFWLFQGIEAALFVVLALALFALAYRLVMRMR